MLSGTATRLFGVKRSWWKIICVSLVLTGALLTILLAGGVPKQDIRIVNGQNYLGPTYEESPNATVGYADDFSGWSMSGAPPPGATATLSNSSSGLILSGSFGSSPNSGSVEIDKTMFVNLTEFQTLQLQINVSKGVGYGIRAFSTADGRSIPLWYNLDVLDHRPGQGKSEDIQLNMLTLSKANTGTTAANVTELQIYVERAPEPTVTNFTLALGQLEFVDHALMPFEAGQQYHAVYFTFADLPVQGHDWTLDKINLDLQLTGSPSTSFEIVQLNGTSAQATVLYHYSPDQSGFQYTLYPSGNAVAFTDPLPPPDNYTLVVLSVSGVLSQVKLQSAAFVYEPVQNSQLQNPTSQAPYWYLYLVVFLFLVPLTAALLLYDEFRRDKLTPTSLALGVVIGLVCRLALAPVVLHPFDIDVYATSASGWFEYGIPNGSLGPTLPFTFSLYWVFYSFYALLLKLGFHDFYILNHQVGFVQSFFLKAFPIVSDLFVFYLLLKFSSGSKVGKMLAVLYLLNPLSIYISGVWGQYEPSTIAMIVLGFLFVSKQGGPKGDFKASLAFVFSALVEIVGLVPLTLLLVKTLFSRPFKIARLLLVLGPVVVLVVYRPELHLIYLIFAGSIGASSTLTLGQALTPFTLASSFPAIAAFHPFVVLLSLTGLVFIVRRKFDLENMVTFTILAFLVFLLFSAQLPQWWVFMLPLCAVYAMVSKNYGIGVFMLPLGAVTAFLILTFTQGSGYMLFGSHKFDVLPFLEDATNGIDVYVVTTTVCALVVLGYVVSRGGITGKHTLIRTSVVIFATLLVSYFWFILIGVSL